MHPDSFENVADFRRLVDAAPSNTDAEKWVREFVGGIAGTCPMRLLVLLAETAADFRSEELQRESETN